MRKIIIPTDFTVASLQLIEFAVLNFPNDKLDIRLIAGYRLPDSRWAITHFSEREQLHKEFSEDFIDFKRRLEKEHKDTIGSISFEVFTGVNSFAFQNFIEQIEAEDAIVPTIKALKCTGKKWFDATNFIKKNLKNVIEVPIEFEEEVTEKKFSLINIFG